MEIELPENGKLVCFEHGVTNTYYCGVCGEQCEVDESEVPDSVDEMKEYSFQPFGVIIITAKSAEEATDLAVKQ